ARRRRRRRPGPRPGPGDHYRLAAGPPGRGGGWWLCEPAVRGWDADPGTDRLPTPCRRGSRIPRPALPGLAHRAHPAQPRRMDRAPRAVLGAVRRGEQRGLGPARARRGHPPWRGDRPAQGPLLAPLLATQLIWLPKAQVEKIRQGALYVR